MKSLVSTPRQRQKIFQTLWRHRRLREHICVSFSTATVWEDRTTSILSGTAPPSIGLPLVSNKRVIARFVSDCTVETKILCTSSARSLIWRSLPLSASTLEGRWFSARTFSTQSPTQQERVYLNMKDCHSVDEASEMAFEKLDKLNASNLAAFWGGIPQLLTDQRGRRNHRARGRLSDAQYQEVMDKIFAIFNKTLDEMREFNEYHLPHLALGLAKIVREVESPRVSKSQEQNREILQSLIGQNSQRKHKLFHSIAVCAIPLLSKFDARCLSNLAYANAIAGTVPRLEDGTTLLDHVAKRSSPILNTFIPQGLANMVWSYEKLGESNPALFVKVAKEIVARDDLGTFKPQNLSNILWAYSKAGVRISKLYDKVANYAIGLDNLGEFQPQHFSNIVWAFAKAKKPNSSLFQKVGDHIVEFNNLNSFRPQELSNLVWAFAKAEESHELLFEKFADHIIGLNHLNSFKPQEISNTVWAFAKAEVSHPRLFEKVADHIINLNNLISFLPQTLANTVWAFATAGVADPRLFQKVADHITGLEDLISFSSQGLSNTVWAFAKAGQSNAALFQKIADYIIELNNLDSFKPQELSNTVWAFAKAGECHPYLFQRVADHIHALDNLQSFNEKHAAQILWAYASANSVDLALFKKLHDHLEANVDYASLDKDTRSALLRAHRKAEHASSKKHS